MEYCVTADNIAERFEGGSLSRVGAVKVVDLHGTWRQMGRQYGKLLSSELAEVYAFAEGYIRRNGETAINILIGQWAQVSYTLRSFMEGMAETSGLTLGQLHRANAVERVSGLPLCSAVFAWGDYAKDRLVVGRNYDYGEQFHALKNDVAVTVYHPADGSLVTATVGYAGEVYAVNALNEKGIFMELNSGLPSAPMLPPEDRITGTTLLLNMMLEADTLDYADAFFNTSKCSEAYVINMADATTAVSYEWCPVGMHRGGNDLPKGLLVSTNHYVSPAWDLPVPTDETSWQSLTRRENLLRLCGENRGAIDPERMRHIMEIPMGEGGARDPFTVYQLVAVPETRRLWLRIVGAADWTEIDMDSFFRQSNP